jgi:hypothetical protein
MSSTESLSRIFMMRLPHNLYEQLEQAAIREANGVSAVARRLIAKGLEREGLRGDEHRAPRG